MIGPIGEVMTAFHEGVRWMHWSPRRAIYAQRCTLIYLDRDVQSPENSEKEMKK